jgi:6,7-dimethyl-8-ribityllumazine synthase
MNQTHASQSIAARALPVSASGTFHSKQPTRIAFVRAGWHADIVGQAWSGFSAECTRLWPGDPPAIDVHELPGAFEIPLLAQTLPRRGQHDAIVACALVVDGGIYRHDFVAHAVIDGLMRVQLDTGVPVFSVVLTPKDFHEHATHRDFFTQHFVAKGAEAARAVAQTLAAHAALAG